MHGFSLDSKGVPRHKEFQKLDRYATPSEFAALSVSIIDETIRVAKFRTFPKRVEFALVDVNSFVNFCRYLHAAKKMANVDRKVLEKLMSIKPVHELLSAERRYAKYSATEYIQYCRQIRESLFHTDEEPVDKKFLERTFVDEMEPLARICEAIFEPVDDTFRVCHCDEELTDGRITCRGKEIFVEFTCAKDHQYHRHVLQQYEKGSILPFSEYLEGNIPPRKPGRRQPDPELSGVENHILDAIERIESKLDRKWPNRINWLCVVMDDVSFTPEEVGARLNKVFDIVRTGARSSNIAELWFVGYRSLIKRFPVQ